MYPSPMVRDSAAQRDDVLAQRLPNAPDGEKFTRTSAAAAARVQARLGFRVGWDLKVVDCRSVSDPASR